MFGFLISVAAGFFTSQLEGLVAQPLAKALEGKLTIAAGEMRLLAFMIAMFGAAVVCAALGTGGMFSLIIGGTLGYFAMQIIAVVKGAIDGKSNE